MGWPKSRFRVCVKIPSTPSSWTSSFSEVPLSVQSVPFGVFHVRIEQESRRESLIAPKAGLRWSYARSVWLVDESLIAPKAGGRCSFSRSKWLVDGGAGDRFRHPGLADAARVTPV
jgi:hypothetical protein